MKNTALFFLHKVSEQHSENQFAKAIFNRFNEAGDDVDFKSWQLLDTFFDDETSLRPYDSSQIERDQGDFRFLHLYLRAVRKFPPLSENYYGISFCREEENELIPESTLLLGRNGTGKTSIFDAMEYLFTKNVSAATKMGVSTVDKKEDYMCFAGSSFKNDVGIGVVSKSLNFKLLPLEKLQQDDVRRLCLLPFFCSEYDVDKLIGGKDLSNFIYEQMGYGLVKSIIDKLGDEIKFAVSQDERIANPEDISSQHIDLDKEIEMYANLWTSFLYLVIGLHKEKNPWDTLEKLKILLSKDLQMDNDDDLEYLTNEKDFLGEIMGENVESYLLQQYSTAEQIVSKQAELDDPDSLLKPKIEKTIVWAELNYARKCFHQAIISFIGDNAPYDYSSYIRKYDNYEQELKRESEKSKRESEKSKKEQEAYKKYYANKDVFDDFLNYLKKEVYGTIQKNTETVREMINEILELFVMEDEKMSFTFNKDDGTFDMKITLLDTFGKPIETFTPEKYLNTFRYKLYCMTLKMAIAFSMKKFYSINFPIVIDDIFYSSDFTHRNMVRTYFRILFKKHKDLFPEPKDELQVIFLSHDEVIIEAASRGIRDARAQANRQMLFDYREVDEMITAQTNDNQINIMKLTCSL